MDAIPICDGKCYALLVALIHPVGEPDDDYYSFAIRFVHAGHTVTHADKERDQLALADAIKRALSDADEPAYDADPRNRT